jgi:hypothetical protein
VSIIRVGLAETKRFSEGYEAIFGKKKDEPAQDKPEAKQEQDKAKQQEAEKAKS